MSSVDFSSFLKLMVHKKASDLFITAGIPPSIKVNGRIGPITQGTLTPQQSRDMVLNVMTPTQREEFEKTHECNFAISMQGVGRFRVSCFYQRNQVGMVLRRIETRIPTIEELNLPAIVKTLAMTKRGIIIFVGATGTGKSTSLAAMIGYRNQNSTGHIITIEDPIEFVHKHDGCIITQREVGIDTDSWENALKNTLRQAPDVIMIGEVRTREGMDHAIAFAETGHLVLCTLHANNANQAMDRIINFFTQAKMAGFGEGDGVVHALAGAHLADHDHVRRLAQGVLQRVVPAVGVDADFALRDDAALVLVHELDRVLDRDDMVRSRLVHDVDQRAERGRLA